MNPGKNINQPSVLIVDDNIKNIEVLGKFLQDEGISVEFALDGATALGWLEKKSFDLILLDIMMPGMDGYEVCSGIKKNPLTCEIPVIFLTAKTDSESIVKGFDCGAVDYVTKPFIHKELLARVNSQIQIKKAKDEIKQYLAVIEAKNKDITDSITYARNIQKAILNKLQTVKQLPEHFILLLPKDIVSGDFFWIGEIDDIIVIAILDCTGHGVPGAFMSILGITLLNEIILYDRITQPEKILQKLRNEIICSLGQKGDIRNIKDGMEGGLICYDRSKGIIRFSGSYNPLILIRNNELKELKADRFPVGYYENMKDFTFIEINVERDDMVYLFTDGFADQFGGPDKKKFTRKRLFELLQNIHLQPVDLQKQWLYEAFNHWKGELNQTDDVLVAGFRF